jgi:peptidoglycan-associated lipoprotein
MRKWIIAAFAVAALAGCATTDTQDPAPVEEGGGAATTAPAGGATTSGTTTSGVTGAATGGAAAAGAHKDPKSILSQKRSVYFDYDQFVIKDEHKAVVEAHAKYLQGTRTLRITLQGNTDERGTREYNIALGQKRADAVKKLMQLLGATEVQIETVSFGKEKPRRDGHDEVSWAENRRVDIVYFGE